LVAEPLDPVVDEPDELVELAPEPEDVPDELAPDELAPDELVPGSGVPALDPAFSDPSFEAASFEGRDVLEPFRLSVR
jgi:hypothetical protein